MKPKITKIKLSKEELEEVDKLLKGEKETNTKLVDNQVRGYSYEFTTKRPISKDMVKKRMTELYGGICTGCGYVWPDYKVSYDYEGATRIERYCSTCWIKWKDRL